MVLKSRLRDFIVEDLQWSGSRDELTDDYPLLDNSVIDSMAIFELVTFLEEDCGVEVADEDLVPENFQSINAIASLAEKNAEPAGS